MTRGVRASPPGRRESAREHYAVLFGRDMNVDREATEALRARLDRVLLDRHAVITYESPIN